MTESPEEAAAREAVLAAIQEWWHDSLRQDDWDAPTPGLLAALAAYGAASRRAGAAAMPCTGCEKVECDGWWLDRFTPIDGCCAHRDLADRCPSCTARAAQAQEAKQ